MTNLQIIASPDFHNVDDAHVLWPGFGAFAVGRGHSLDVEPGAGSINIEASVVFIDCDASSGVIGSAAVGLVKSIILCVTITWSIIAINSSFPA